MQNGMDTGGGRRVSKDVCVCFDHRGLSVCLLTCHCHRTMEATEVVTGQGEGSSREGEWEDL